MIYFDFNTDEESQLYCEEIVREVIRLFGLSEEEAIGRLNQALSGLDMTGENSIYENTPEWWAKTLCYPPNILWWNEDESKLPLRPFP